ncbi:bestrophin family protein [Rhodanobacter sp. BL-MT-08]
MIVPGRVRPRQVLQVLHYVGRPLALLFFWDVAVTAGYLATPYKFDVPALPLSLIGSAIAVFLAFRNTTAYARWWEARTLWGAMVNASRTFARELKMLLPSGSSTVRADLVRRHIAYVHALRLHLRRQSPWGELQQRLPADELEQLRAVTNVPNAILDRSAQIIGEMSDLDSMKLATLARTLSDFSNAQGGMERINNTPFPRQYATYPVVFTHGFCLLLPLGLVGSLGIYTPLGSTVAGFLFLALLQIGNDMQAPFANTENDVPMTSLTRSIEIVLRDGLDEAHQLKPVDVENGVLW